MNQILVVGTVSSDYKIIYKDDKTKNKLIKFTLKVQKPYKNKEGIYDFDYINIKVWDKILQDVEEMLSYDQILGIKGRINSNPFINKDGIKIYLNDILAENVTNLTLI